VARPSSSDDEIKAKAAAGFGDHVVDAKPSFAAVGQQGGARADRLSPTRSWLNKADLVSKTICACRARIRRMNPWRRSTRHPPNVPLSAILAAAASTWTGIVQLEPDFLGPAHGEAGMCMTSTAATITTITIMTSRPRPPRPRSQRPTSRRL